MNSPMLLPDLKPRSPLTDFAPALQAEQMEGSPIPDHRERPDEPPEEPKDIENTEPDTESEP